MSEEVQKLDQQIAEKKKNMDDCEAAAQKHEAESRRFRVARQAAKEELTVLQKQRSELISAESQQKAADSAQECATRCEEAVKTITSILEQATAAAQATNESQANANKMLETIQQQAATAIEEAKAKIIAQSAQQAE